MSTQCLRRSRGVECRGKGVFPLYERAGQGLPSMSAGLQSGHPLEMCDR
jgi:hypothetical protein